MFVFTPFVILALTAVGRVASETYKKGDKAVLSPGSVSGPITSITWKHGPHIAVDWYGQEPTEYRDFKGRCELNTNTGALTILNLSVNDSGSYTAEINNSVMETTEIKVITAVPKPTINKQCNSEVTQCTLTCDAIITADMGTITYSWKTGDSQMQAESPSNQLDITKDDTESAGKLISCQLENPVSSERSDDIMSPFTNESSVGGITAAVVSVLLIVLLIVLVGVCVHKRRSGNADQSWCQYLARFNPRNCPNCGRTNRQTREQNHQERPETARLISENANGAATSPASQTVPNQDQAKPVSTGTTNGAAIPENQEDPTQHQPEPEPTDTNNGAEMPQNTSERQNEVGPDQTPAEPTDPSSEAETSAEAPNAEEPPDHHHQQEDETTEE